MAKDVINVDGEEKVVREDTAKSYRGVVWALGSIALIVIAAAIVFFLFFAKTATDNSNTTTPGTIEQQRR